MINWSLNFSVNVKEIDEQHKVMISIIDRAKDMLISEDYSFNSLYDLLVELDGYMTVHFQYEEKLMREHNFPGMEDHVNQHNQFRKDMGQLNVFNVNQPKEFIQDALVYLMNWLSSHIMNTDKKLGDYLSSFNNE